MRRARPLPRLFAWLAATVLVLALFVPPAGQTAAAGSWSVKASMTTARNGLSLGADGNAIYSAGGWNGTHRTVLEVYNPATDAWTTKASMLGPQTNAAPGMINGTLYLAGGTNTSVEINTLTAYNPSTDQWTARANMPTIRQGAAGSVVSGKLYVAGAWQPTAAQATAADLSKDGKADIADAIARVTQLLQCG